MEARVNLEARELRRQKRDRLRQARPEFDRRSLSRCYPPMIVVRCRQTPVR